MFLNQKVAEDTFKKSELNIQNWTAGRGYIQEVWINVQNWTIWIEPLCNLSDDVDEYGPTLEWVIRDTQAVAVKALVTRSRNPN